jgi:hypothetical protein
MIIVTFIIFCLIYSGYNVWFLSQFRRDIIQEMEEYKYQMARICDDKFKKDKELTWPVSQTH